MRALLDTNIIIHRETAKIIQPAIGSLFFWLDKLRYEKCIHPTTIEEIQKHGDPGIRSSFAAKLDSYRKIKLPAPLSSEVAELSGKYDRTQNDLNDSIILNELFCNRVDVMITEDRGVAAKSILLGISDRVFTIESFLEKVTAENPELVNYPIPSIRKLHFGDIDIKDEFFDSFRRDYPNFNKWFGRKADETAYVCYSGEKVAAFLYIKIEGEDEPYNEINPSFLRMRRLKIGTFKVEMNGFKLGERFLKIIFDNAMRQRIGEIYVTLFNNSIEQEMLSNLFVGFGFKRHGIKRNSYGDEQVYVRDMSPLFNRAQPNLTFPFISRKSRAFLVPIYDKYHTALFPDSILRTESPLDFIEHQPHRNAVRKVYISRSIYRDLVAGDVIIFYRTGGYYKAVVTTIGIVDETHMNIPDLERFVALCRKRSVFSDEELRAHWEYKKWSKPFIVDFLYAYSFPKRPNMKELIENNVIKDVDSAPRGFEKITNQQFETIIRLSNTDTHFIVD